jgi:hypothetical protein
VRGDNPDRPWLGLDLDDTALSGDPVPVGVTLHGTQADERTRVQVRARASDGRQEGGTPWLPFTRTGDGRWQADLPPLVAGTYTVEITATGVPAVDRLRAGDVLGMVDADDAGADV